MCHHVVFLSAQEGCNFREFMKTLAHFRRCSKKGQNPLNTEEEKLKCMLEISMLFFMQSHPLGKYRSPPIHLGCVVCS